MRDPIWDTVRWALGMGGMFLVGRGYATAEQANQMADLIVQVAAASVTIGMFAWQVWVRWGTVAVPVAAVAEIEAVKQIAIPTVSSATGQVTPA